MEEHLGTANDLRVVEVEISEETSQSQPKTLSPDRLPPLNKVRESILNKVQKFPIRTPNGLGTAIEKPPGTESAPPPPHTHTRNRFKTTAR